MRRTMPSVQNAWPSGRIAASVLSVTCDAALIGATSRNPVCEMSLTSHGPPVAPHADRRRRARSRRRSSSLRECPNTAISIVPPKLLVGVDARQRVALLLVQVAGDLGEADDRVDDADRGRALAAPRERPELGVDLRGELREERELLAAPRRLVGQRLVADLLLDRHDVLHQHRVQRPRVEEQHASLERARACGA
jgi:hypothetical protein